MKNLEIQTEISKKASPTEQKRWQKESWELKTK